MVVVVPSAVRSYTAFVTMLFNMKELNANQIKNCRLRACRMENIINEQNSAESNTGIIHSTSTPTPTPHSTPGYGSVVFLKSLAAKQNLIFPIDFTVTLSLLTAIITTTTAATITNILLLLC